MQQRLMAYVLMTKPRAMLVVLATAAAGYLLAVQGDPEWTTLANLLLGTGMSGGGSIALNQWIERFHDGHMKRTAGRPLPAGHVDSASALTWGIFLSVVGVAWLAWTTNPLTALLAAACVASYVLLYTPLKRITPLNTVVGAVPGAIPPMMGWTAYTGSVQAPAWVLFLILFVWQFPHFLAIGWLYREDYKRAGYTMLSGIDAAGTMTARQMILNAALLLVTSLAPVSLGLAGRNYAFGAVALGVSLLFLTVAFGLSRTDRRALWVLRGTVTHIALLMTLLVIDKV